MEAKIWAVAEEAASGLHWINGHLSVNKSWCRTVGEALRPQTNMIRAINKTPKLGWGGGGSPECEEEAQSGRTWIWGICY